MRWHFLVGFMGVGKTTLGAEVAERLGWPFYDLDDEIVAAVGTTIPELFAAAGEDGFREHETEALREVLAGRVAGIVATGGGAFTLQRNRDAMHAAGRSIWLDVPFEVAQQRSERRERPLWSNDARARELAESRRKYYRLADFHLDLGKDSVARSSERLYRLLAADPG